MESEPNDIETNFKFEIIAKESSETSCLSYLRIIQNILEFLSKVREVKKLSSENLTLIKLSSCNIGKKLLSFIHFTGFFIFPLFVLQIN